jgi:hypothetical protein
LTNYWSEISFPAFNEFIEFIELIEFIEFIDDNGNILICGKYLRHDRNFASYSGIHPDLGVTGDIMIMIVSNIFLNKIVTVRNLI